MNIIRVALAPFLGSCPLVVTLGVRPCLDDYSNQEKNLMRSAAKIFFPTNRFVDLFQAIEIPTFPSSSTYRYQRSRVLQQLLFQCMELPQPRSRIYFGRQKERILKDFQLPLILQGPRTGRGTTHLVHRVEPLEECILRYNPIIVREAIAWDQRIRLVCVNFECIAAFRMALRHGDPSPPEPIDLHHSFVKGVQAETMELLRRAKLDDILIEWRHGNGSWHLIELAKPPSIWNDISGRVRRHVHICDLIGRELL
jgi:hypothetical protein